VSSARHPLHEVVVAGAFNSRQAKVLEGETSLSITLEAVLGALADAGIKASEVDGVSITSGMSNQLIAQYWVHLLGGNACWTANAGLTGVPAVLEAAAAIAAGYCNTVVIANGQAGTYTERAATAPWTRPSNEFVECYGLYTAVEFALIARRHMHLYGTTPEHLAEVAATIRNHGHRNAEAVYCGKGPFTRNDILASRMVADPYHLLDCSMTSEGAAAVVLTRADRARDLARPPVHVLGGGLDRRGLAYTMAPVWDEAGYVGRPAAQRAFAMAGCTPQDVDVCEFYDPFSFEIIRQFEAFGFCPEGEGGPFIMGGRIGLEGEYPTCTDGGTMSFSHPGTAQLLQKVVSAVRQVRGDHPNQVPGASIAMATNGGAGALFTDVLLVGREPA
jgi:acetyl-CoA acetyltransferase